MQTPRNLNNLPLASHPLFKAGDVDHARHTLSRLYTSINLEPCTKSKAFHFWTWHDIYDSNLGAVRKTYDGPLTLADDMTVWNVTDAQIVVREAITTEDVAPTTVRPKPTEPLSVNPMRSRLSGFLRASMLANGRVIHLRQCPNSRTKRELK